MLRKFRDDDKLRWCRRKNSYFPLTFLDCHLICHSMRTISEHVSSRIRQVGKRFKRFARAAMGRVRKVLKRVRGGVRHRHMEEASICAPAITACCHTRKAEFKRGLPGGRPVKVLSSPVARGNSAQGRGVLSFQTQINHPCAIDARHAENRSDQMHLPPVKSERHGATLNTFRKLQARHPS